ncbi:PWI domain-containing protein [Colletotrichum abscissum]|uniref:PWI domain-containing protein n=1 Tax=Colletotrichum abscissum TaxID=1671311 RepID=UPI0027D6EA7A|nr:PWI domain-containing protein [Colletotrichum abscissum]KAK1523613.1 PWI domain-containing protein [Colletotrichum abscissum]
MATGVDAKLLKSTKFPAEFNQKVDMQKVNLQVMKKHEPRLPLWIASKISDILGSEDDVVIELCFNLIEGPRFPDIKALQIQLTGFLDKDTAPFCRELWKLFLSAQTSPQGVPKELLEAKKLELIQEKPIALQTRHDAAEAISTGVNKMARHREIGIAVNADAAAAAVETCGVVATVTGTTTKEVDTEDGLVATGRAHRLRGTVIRGTEARSVGPLETAMSQGITVSIAEYLAVVATTRALRLRHPPPHGRAAPIASGILVVARPRPPPDELVENAAYPAPGLREIDRRRREEARGSIANHEGKGDLHEALRRPQHRLINGRLQSAVDTPLHGVVRQVVRDDPAVEARTQHRLEVLDHAAVALRVEPLGDVQVRDLEAVPDIATIVASLALRIPALAEQQPMILTRLIARAGEAKERERVRQKEAGDATHSLAHGDRLMTLRGDFQTLHNFKQADSCVTRR